jgi:hypothetical protein
MRKSRQTRVAAQLNEWLTSPTLQPPERRISGLSCSTDDQAIRSGTYAVFLDYLVTLHTDRSKLLIPALGDGLGRAVNRSTLTGSVLLDHGGFYICFALTLQCRLCWYAFVNQYERLFKNLSQI